MTFSPASAKQIFAESYTAKRSCVCAKRLRMQAACSALVQVSDGVHVAGTRTSPITEARKPSCAVRPTKTCHARSLSIQTQNLMHITTLARSCTPGYVASDICDEICCMPLPYLVLLAESKFSCAKVFSWRIRIYSLSFVCWACTRQSIREVLSTTAAGLQAYLFITQPCPGIHQTAEGLASPSHKSMVEMQV